MDTEKAHGDPSAYCWGKFANGETDSCRRAPVAEAIVRRSDGVVARQSLCGTCLTTLAMQYRITAIDALPDNLEG